MNTLISRIAPTPSGFLHEGNAFNFILTWLITRSANGTLHLRIDDIDQVRVRPEYLEDIFNSLDWLGIDWDAGPQSVAQHTAEFSQIHRLPLYQNYLLHLQQSGVLFACTCSRKEIKEMDETGKYPSTCRSAGLSFDEAESCWRIKTSWPSEESWEDAWMGDITVPLDPSLQDCILRKKDALPAYQITSIVDDLCYGVNTIVRGEDLLPSTMFQRWMIRHHTALDPDAISWVHHPLVLSEKGEKLSKSAGDISLQSSYNRGESSEKIIRKFAEWMNWEGFEGRTTADLLAYWTSP